MGLNIVSSGGNFDPWVKYNAKAGKWLFKDGDEEVEVMDPSFVADFSNIKTGWFLFMEGQAPDKVYDIDLNTLAPKPSDAHKRGFELRLFSKASFKGVVEMCSSSMHVCNAINALYDQYEADNAGKLPVIKANGVTPSKDKFGTNYKPNLSIEKWVTRPAEFDAKAEANDDIPHHAPKAAATNDASEF